MFGGFSLFLIKITLLFLNRHLFSLGGKATDGCHYTQMSRKFAYYIDVVQTHPKERRKREAMHQYDNNDIFNLKKHTHAIMTNIRRQNNYGDSIYLKKF